MRTKPRLNHSSYKRDPDLVVDVVELSDEQNVKYMYMYIGLSCAIREYLNNELIITVIVTEKKNLYM